MPRWPTLAGPRTRRRPRRPRRVKRGPRSGRFAELPFQIRLHEWIEVAVEDRRRVACLPTRSMILDHIVRVQDIGANLVTPAGFDVLAFELGSLGLALLFLD